VFEAEGPDRLAPTTLVLPERLNRDHGAFSRAGGTQSC
jgi:hypothetical protein